MAWYFKFCRLVKLALFFNAGYPCLKHSEIMQKVAIPSTSEEELNEYLEISSKNLGAKSIVFILFYFAYFIKCFVIAYYSLSWFDHKNLDKNIEYVENSNDHLSKVTCLTTNCTRLSQTNRGTLAEDMSKLPVVALCNPVLSSFYCPIQHMDSYGLLIYTTFGLCVLFLGAILPLAQMLYPGNNESMIAHLFNHRLQCTNHWYTLSRDTNVLPE